MCNVFLLHHHHPLANICFVFAFAFVFAFFVFVFVFTFVALVEVGRRWGGGFLGGTGERITEDMWGAHRVYGRLWYQQGRGCRQSCPRHKRGFCFHSSLCSLCALSLSLSFFLFLFSFHLSALIVCVCVCVCVHMRACGPVCVWFPLSLSLCLCLSLSLSW